MNLEDFCKKLPKVELHAHLNGSLSSYTLLELKRYYADSGLKDTTDAFHDPIEYSAGDIINLADCFHIFNVAHSLTTTPKAVEIAVSRTIQEFEEDGCIYLELRSTPRDTPLMTKSQYIETVVTTIQRSLVHLKITTRFIVSINRKSTREEGEEIAALAVEYHKKYPGVVVGIELSGNPAIGKFEDFIPALTLAKDAGLKVALHCGEVYNPEEILKMIKFKPDRIGHGTCIHPKYLGTDETWSELCKSGIPVEICLTSNVNTKSTPDYESHHFKHFHEANVPVILCTDDKGVFATALSQEYKLCAYAFNLSQSELANLALVACEYVFDENLCETLKEKVRKFISNHPS